MEIIYKLDLAIGVVSLAALIFLVGWGTPLIIAPLDDYETLDGNVLFSIENADGLLIDDNIDFTTPVEYVVEDGLSISLEPGKYYWKAVGIFGSEVRTLTIKSKVSLELQKVDEGYDVVNSGNVRLNVDVYNGSKLVGVRSLDVGESLDVEGTKFVGGAE